MPTEDDLAAVVDIVAAARQAIRRRPRWLGLR
jgi:hypothetical protein